MKIDVAAQGAHPGGVAAVTVVFEERTEAMWIACAAVVRATNALGDSTESVHVGHQIDVDRVIDVGERFVLQIPLPADLPATFETEACSVNWLVEVTVVGPGRDRRETTEVLIATPPTPISLAADEYILDYLHRRRRVRSSFGSSLQWGVGGIVVVALVLPIALVVASESRVVNVAMLAGGALTALAICFGISRWFAASDMYPFAVDAAAARRGHDVHVVLDRPAAEPLSVALVTRTCTRTRVRTNVNVKLAFAIVSTSDIGIGDVAVELPIPPSCHPTCTLHSCEVDHWVRVMRPQDANRRQGFVRRRSDRPLYVTP